MNSWIAFAPKVVATLKRRYTDKGMVDLGDPEDTLIATLLSARTTDVQVLKVYPGLRKKFPTLKSFMKADVADIAASISSLGLYRSKARAIQKLATRLVTEYEGKIPKTMEDLTSLAGVGRKTASCVLWYGFGIPAMAVDTHVFRITRRLGWTRGKTAEHVEKELMKDVPKRYWGDINRTMVQFGRDVCRPGTPHCWRCPVAKWCAYQPKTPPPVAR
jgi:endonuclease-3